MCGIAGRLSELTAGRRQVYTEYGPGYAGSSPLFRHFLLDGLPPESREKLLENVVYRPFPRGNTSSGRDSRRITSAGSAGKTSCTCWTTRQPRCRSYPCSPENCTTPMSAARSWRSRTRPPGIFLSCTCGCPDGQQGRGVRRGFFCQCRARATFAQSSYTARFV